MLSRLFIAVLWSSAGKGLNFLLLLVMFIAFLLLPMWNPGSGLVLVIFAVFLTINVTGLLLTYHFRLFR